MTGRLASGPISTRPFSMHLRDMRAAGPARAAVDGHGAGAAHADAAGEAVGQRRVEMALHPGDDVEHGLVLAPRHGRTSGSGRPRRRARSSGRSIFSSLLGHGFPAAKARIRPEQTYTAAPPEAMRALSHLLQPPSPRWAGRAERLLSLLAFPASRAACSVCNRCRRRRMPSSSWLCCWRRGSTRLNARIKSDSDRS